MNYRLLNLVTVLFLILLQSFLFAQLTPKEAIAGMTRGINLGNTLEPPKEGEWNNVPAKEYYFDDYKTAGFDCIRIPIRWDNYTGKTAPYTVTETWMDRVEEVIDWGLSRDLYIIINSHHDDWIKDDYSETNKARYDSIWSQIAIRFKDKSEKLLFEMINEPHGLTVAQVDDVNARVLSIIRETNPTRIVIFSGNEWSNLEQLTRAKIPEDEYLIGYYHSYDPWNFAGEGLGTWGSTSQVNVVKNKFQSAANWATAKNIPVIISEFGAQKKCDYNSRMLHYYTYIEQSLSKNVVFQAWDDGGDFGIYERSTRTWHEVKDILINTYIDGPTQLKIKSDADTTVTLTWQNRTTENMDIIIERKMNDGEFVQYAKLDANVAEFIDDEISTGNYYYRVIATMSNDKNKYSYPVKVYLEPSIRSPYGLIPFDVPGTIEAEEYDVGGESLTYHDTEEENIPGAFRPAEGVDIETRDDGGYHVAYTESGEWTEYSISVAQAGNYDITVYTASMDGGGKLMFKAGSNSSNLIDILITNSWQTNTTTVGSIILEEGEQILRMTIVDSKPFNIDKFVLDINTTDIEGDGSLLLTYVLNQNYPNPFNPTTVISYTVGTGQLSASNLVELAVYDMLGKEVAMLVNEPKQAGTYEIGFNATNLPSGIYFYQLKVDSRLVDTKKMTLLK